MEDVERFPFSRMSYIVGIKGLLGHLLYIYSFDYYMLPFIYV